MNVPVKIAQSFLRLNGFFCISSFTMLKEPLSDIDLLALRPAGGKEELWVKSTRIELPLDKKFFREMKVTESESVGIVAEVEGGSNCLQVDDIRFDYARAFFGNFSNKMLKLAFVNIDDYEMLGDTLNVPLRKCLEFIRKRVDDVQKIKKKYRVRFTKEGTWDYYEDFLGDILYLVKSDLI